MTDGFASIITALEQQKAAIDRALSALREVNGMTTVTTEPAPVGSSRKGRKLSAEARKRMAEGQRKRYAHLHKEPTEAVTTSKEPEPGRKGKKRTAAQRKRMAEAQRKRYADAKANEVPF